MEDTDLEQLTLKTAFLLALASGKRHSEIHVWVENKISNLANGKMLLVPFFRFHSQKPTSKRRFSSVSPVTIPALTTIVETIQRRQDLVSGTGPEVLFGLNQRPKRVLIPSLYLL